MSDHVQLKNDVNLFFFRIFISILTIRRILVITSRDFTHYDLATHWPSDLQFILWEKQLSQPWNLRRKSQQYFIFHFQLLSVKANDQIFQKTKKNSIFRPFLALLRHLALKIESHLFFTFTKP